ncbi:MAG: hypothetical protein OZSIB_1646 [Candidatus Ozemobacter sibiricus]|jgi:hypothetical protein|uniref:Glycine zipper domain-containing protein n=1 Tax=Candidatus Ozemobacter sibiricus TaxID=2268124 RepID=A0A367ZKJ0_9BACT|nr:MAG: hypothetical protein OZSIB_1646 [Candidatus Ozemobacter sibiricus]
MFRGRSFHRLAGFLAGCLLIQLIVVPPVQAANEAVRRVTGGVLGFLAGAVAMTALGVGGLAVVAGCVAGAYVGKWVGKHWNSFFKARKQEVAQGGQAVAGASAATAQRLREQEEKAAQFINALTGQPAQAVASGPAPTAAEIEEAMNRYQAAYRAYSEAARRGDTAAAQKYAEEYRTLQARYQAMLKGQRP